MNYPHPLHMAAAIGKRPGVIRELVMMFGVNKLDNSCRTPLMFAALGNNKGSTCSSLLKCSADVNAQDVSGLTALHVACYHGNVSAAGILIANQASVASKDNKVESSLQTIWGDHYLFTFLLFVYFILVVYLFLFTCLLLASMFLFTCSIVCFFNLFTCSLFVNLLIVCLLVCCLFVCLYVHSGPYGTTLEYNTSRHGLFGATPSVSMSQKDVFETSHFVLSREVVLLQIVLYREVSW